MSQLSLVIGVSVAAMLAGWLVQLRRGDAGIVDVIWAFGMVAAGIFYALAGSGPGWLRIVLAVLTTLWFLRLGLHILARARSEEEDGRYRAMRAAMGNRAGVGFLAFFMLQAGFIALLSLPFYAVANTLTPLPWSVALGIVVAGLAFAGETASDRQLQRFRSDPRNRGRTCRVGWWKFSRHPNYFFEWMHWIAYPLMAMGGQFASITWLTPVVMWLFLRYFTGVPFCEQQALRSRGEDYRRYQQQTSVFFPWPPSAREI